MTTPAQIKEIKNLKQRAVTPNPGTKTPIYISASVVKNHCLRLPSALGEGKNLICAFFAGPRCHKEFHFPLFIHLYFTDGSCSSLTRPPSPLLPTARFPRDAPQPFFRLPQSPIRLSECRLISCSTVRFATKFNI